MVRWNVTSALYLRVEHGINIKWMSSEWIGVMLNHTRLIMDFCREPIIIEYLCQCSWNAARVESTNTVAPLRITNSLNKQPVQVHYHDEKYSQANTIYNLFCHFKTFETVWPAFCALGQIIWMYDARKSHEAAGLAETQDSVQRDTWYHHCKWHTLRLHISREFERQYHWQGYGRNGWSNLRWSSIIEPACIPQRITKVI